METAQANQNVVVFAPATACCQIQCDCRSACTGIFRTAKSTRDFFLLRPKRRSLTTSGSRAFYPESQLATLSKSWYESVRAHGGKITFDDDTIRTSGAIDVASIWLTQTCLPELAQSDQLMGCTVGDLRRVLAAIHVYSLFVIVTSLKM